MSCYISQYVKTCDLCLYTKVQQSPPVRELSPLPTPESHWDTISVDFIVELPESHGYDAIMNVVDSMSKVSHFIPTHTTITALRQPTYSSRTSGSCMDFRNRLSLTEVCSS